VGEVDSAASSLALEMEGTTPPLNEERQQNADPELIETPSSGEVSDPDDTATMEEASLPAEELISNLAIPEESKASAVEDSNDNSAGKKEGNDEEEEVECNACGFESSFVPEGMLYCEKCNSVAYCSADCKQWDWDSGGHKRKCVALRKTQSTRSLRSGGTFNDSAASGFISISSNSNPTLGSMHISDVFTPVSIGYKDGSSSSLASKSGHSAGLAANLWENERNTPLPSTSGHSVEMVADPTESPRTKQARLSDFFEQQQQHPYHPSSGQPIVAVQTTNNQQQLSRIESDNDAGDPSSSSISASFDASSGHSKPRMSSSANANSTLLKSQHSAGSADEFSEDQLMDAEFLSGTMEKEEKMNDMASFADDGEEFHHDATTPLQQPTSLQEHLQRPPDTVDAGVSDPFAEDADEANNMNGEEEDEDSFDILEEEAPDDNDTVLQSIIEEESEVSGDEPDKEGSWRSRDLYDDEGLQTAEAEVASLLDDTPNQEKPDASHSEDSSGHFYEVVDVVEYSTNTDGQSFSSNDDSEEIIYMTTSEYAKHKQMQQQKRGGRRPSGGSNSGSKRPKISNSRPLPANMGASGEGVSLDSALSTSSVKAEASVASNDFGSILGYDEAGEESGASSHQENNEEDEKSRHSERSGSERTDENYESFAADTGHEVHMLSDTGHSGATGTADSFADQSDGEEDDILLPKTKLKESESGASHDTIRSLSSHFDSESEDQRINKSSDRSEGKRSLLDLPSVQNSKSTDSEESAEPNAKETSEEEDDDDSLEDLKDVRTGSTPGRRSSSGTGGGSSGNLSAFNNSADFDLDDAESVRSNSFANAVALKDFRQAYTQDGSVTSSNSRSLKNFHQVYHSDANSTVGDATTGSRSHTSGSGSAGGSRRDLNRSIGDLHEDLQELNSRNSESNHSKQSLVSKNSKLSLQSGADKSSDAPSDAEPLRRVPSQSDKSSEGGSSQRSASMTRSEALKMSINKALRDYEKLYGEEAARGAFQQLAQAVLSEDEVDQPPVSPAKSAATAPQPQTLTSNAAQPRSGEDEEDNHTTSSMTVGSHKSARKNSLNSLHSLHTIPKLESDAQDGHGSMRSAQSAPPARGVERSKSNQSFSSWALPTDYSVFSNALPTPSSSSASQSPDGKGSPPGQSADITSGDHSPNIEQRMSQLRQEAQKMKVSHGDGSFAGAIGDYNSMALPRDRDDGSESSEEDLIGHIKESSSDEDEDAVRYSIPQEKQGSPVFRNGAAFAPGVAMHVVSAEQQGGADASSNGLREAEPENSAPPPQQSMSPSRTLSLTASSSGGDSGPRYLTYRSLLSKGAEAITSAARMLNFTSSGEEEHPEIGGSGSTSPVTSGSQTSHSDEEEGESRSGYVDRGIFDTKAATAGQDFRFSLSSASSADSRDTSNPRYLRYRSLLANNMTPEKDSPERDSPGWEADFDAIGSSPARTSAIPLANDPWAPVETPERPKISATGALSPGSPRYLQYRSSLAERISVSRGVNSSGGRKGVDSEEMEVAELESKLSSLEAQLASYLSKGENGAGGKDADSESLEKRLAAYLANDGPAEPEFQPTRLSTNKSSRRDSWIGMGMDFSSSADSTSSDASPSPRLPQHLSSKRSSKNSIKTAVAEGTASPYLQFVSSQDSDYSQSVKGGDTIRQDNSTDDGTGLDIDVEQGLTEEGEKFFIPTPSEKKLGKKFRNNRRCAWWSIFILALVSFPLGIALLVSLRENDDGGNAVTSARGSAVTTTSAPSASPVISTAPTISTDPPASAAPVSVPPVSGTTPTRNPSKTLTTQPITLMPSSRPSATPTAPPSLPPSRTPSSVPTTTPTTSYAPSQEPTMAQQFPDLELLALLSAASSDGGTRLQTRDSPQNKAYFWLVATDLSGMTDETKIQRFALATLYYSTNGDDWTNNGLWLTEQDECDWAFAEAPCDASGVVVNLDLAFNNLRGEIPPEIGLLTDLVSIILNGDGSSSQLSGSLPGDLSLLEKIERFSISNNDLSGPIPPGLNWPLATSFDLSKNRLTDRVPDDIGLMVSLENLNLADNMLSSDLTASIGSLTKLEQMDLRGNEFEGPIPASIGNLILLQSINLSNNGFTSLPATIGNLVNLESLDVQSNDLGGQLFDNWAGLDVLTTLDLHDNDLEGPIPVSLGSLAAIQILDLSFNMFSENIPTELGELSTVFHLFLNSNKLTGNIPAALDGLSVISFLRLDDNELEGAVPSELCDTLGDNQVPRFYSDCDVLSGEGKIQCPLGTCCTHCCNGESCECVFSGQLEFLCL